VLVPQLLGRVIRALGTYDGDGERVCKYHWLSVKSLADDGLQLLGDIWLRISSCGYVKVEAACLPSCKTCSCVSHGLPRDDANPYS
jgi:hypothetical protein